MRHVWKNTRVSNVSGKDISSIPSEYDPAENIYWVSIRITDLDQQVLTCMVQIAVESNLKYYINIANEQEYIIFYTLY